MTKTRGAVLQASRGSTTGKVHSGRLRARREEEEQDQEKKDLNLDLFPIGSCVKSILKAAVMPCAA